MKKEKVVFIYSFLVAIMITQTHPKTVFPQSRFDTKSDPIQIDAKEGIEWLSKEQVYIARGSASARKGNFHIKSDVIKAHYRKTDNDDAEEKEEKHEKEFTNDDQLLDERYYFYDHLLK